MAWRHIVVVASAFLAATPSFAAEPWTGVCEGIVDGDTVQVRRGETVVVLDLVEIDAPELGQPFGEEAKAFLEELVMGREVVVTEIVGPTTRAAGARLKIEGVDVGREVIAAGFAWTGDTSDDRLVIARMTARGAKKGLWAQNDPEAPWLYRERHTQVPTPRPKRSLAEVARDIELRKNAEGKAVITGLTPQSGGAGGSRSGSGTPSIDDDGKYHLDFSCPEDGLAGCAEAEFRASYKRFYKEESGLYTTNRMDYGEGRLLFLYKLGLTRGVGVSCQCGDNELCKCSIELAKASN